LIVGFACGLKRQHDSLLQTLLGCFVFRCLARHFFIQSQIMMI
jgi:hypothetical protein